MANECKYYDAELDCCKKLSDWTEPMPILQPCIESPCEYYTKANEWISVKDRLPEQHDAYLCAEWSKTFNEYFVRIRYFAKDLYEWDRFEFPDGKGKSGFYGSDSEWGSYLVDDVTHWMPLPEPPKKEGADNE